MAQGNVELIRAAYEEGSLTDLPLRLMDPVEDYIDRGDYVVVPMVLRGRIRGSGEEVSMPETHVIKMRDGVAVEVREFPTLDEALEAVDLGRVGKLSRIRFFLDHNAALRAAGLE
jgi:ketosteroid isomerase-like protein